MISGARGTGWASEGYEEYDTDNIYDGQVKCTIMLEEKDRIVSYKMMFSTHTCWVLKTETNYMQYCYNFHNNDISKNILHTLW